jgi:hypothetical protein
MPSQKTERKIVLAVREGHIEPRLLASARSLCERMDAELDILARRPEMRRRDIVQYANTHECVSTVVIDSLEGWESVAEDRASDPWARLACPLVTAAPKKPGTAP